MKKAIYFLALVFSGTMTVFAQKKENGIMYIEHPAIKLVDEFSKAMVAGDSAKIANFLAEDFKAYNGTGNTYDDKGTNKMNFVKRALRYSKELDYFSVETFPGSYLDAVEYKKDNKDGDVVVQTWDLMKGLHKATGVKLDAAAHRLFTVSKDNKIKNILNYSNGAVLEEIGASYSERTNGKIYNHHENINTVRKAMYVFEKGDIDKSMSFYSDDAVFYDVNTNLDSSISKTSEKSFLQKFLNDFEIKSIDMVGYPDYLEYEMNDGREVLSWWKYNLVRKKDKKVVKLNIHLSNSFDETGKIVSEIAYYSEAALTR